MKVKRLVLCKDTFFWQIPYLCIMSIVRHAGNPQPPVVRDADSMYRAIRRFGIIPFFENGVPGYSIEELTPPEFWFDGDDGAALGPWDWKIDVVQRGDIAYGKFLCGGKAAFATIEWYRELRNWRQTQDRYRIVGEQEQVMAFLREHGAISIREIRQLLGVKKSAADALLTRLQMQCRVVTGDIQRVYRGADLHYNGWQVSSFCRPEDLFGEDAAPAFGGLVPAGLLDDSPLQTSLAPADSFALLRDHISSLTGAPLSLVEKLLR